MSWAGMGTVDLVQMVASPVSTGNVTCDPSKGILALDNSGLLAAYTVNLPANPVDGQRVTICCGAAITLLTIGGNGNTIKGLLTGLAAGGFAKYTFVAGSPAWFRTG